MRCCKAIANRPDTGRVILSYDTAFLALLLDSLPEPIQGAGKVLSTCEVDDNRYAAVGMHQT